MDKEHVSFKTISSNDFIPVPDSVDVPRPREHYGANGVLVKLKREISLRNGVTLIIGGVIGSGIFVSPGVVLEQNGSYGLSLISWALGGVFSMLGGICYAELGTTITKSSSNYAYILEAFGGFVAFLKLWVSMLIIQPTGQAVLAITFGNYLVQPIFVNCGTPYIAERLIAATCIGIITFVNCASVKWGTKVQDVLTVAKTIGLIIIIIAGLVKLGQGKTDFSSMFSGSVWDADRMILAFYFVLFSYSGWDTLNYVTEEVNNAERNLPLAIFISVPVITVLYILTVLSYYIVLEPNTIISSDTVAMTFAEDVFGMAKWIISIVVAVSCYNTLNATVILASRLYFVAACEGYLPQILSMIHVTRFTPIPALVINGLFTIVYLSVEDIYKLIYYFIFSHWFFIGLAVIGQIYLRWKEPNRYRPIKINIFFPTFFCLCVLGLIAVPVYYDTINSLIGIGIGLTAIPAYFIGQIMSKLKYPPLLRRILAKLMKCMQLIFYCVLIEEGYEEQGETIKKN
ncbi:Y+L amino acid transporter 2-like isoform X2 [Narcine bancroftii]|uniref:Y+L amino acid transporter 2-like isoform X2 n=1 Tax=Narcine bancroftii TaxID=1343680 RepID=UPI00383106AD